MGTPNKEEYAAFEDKVKRTVYIDNLSPRVTESVLRTALNQFGTVVNIQFIPNYLVPGNIPQCALIEMETSKQAFSIVSTLAQFPFMMSGMPRPVRARHAEAEMFDDRPIKPGRKLQFRWVDPSDPDFEVAKKLKHLCRKHSAEAAFMHTQQQKKEEDLTKQQEESLKQNYKKYEMIDGLLADGTARRLSCCYNINLGDD
ncbi:hypothetical protein L484_024733 [Morus notabilis]|uniref:RRM domain-containing protein n=1 Tax=Morus notabilis TaxID=981085 RepID=W9R4X8_9ROSA|nr:uncharacterized protein LOC21407461 [Morus notabilis]EXB68713.1 hypothetical protein L484_024733 [Morus notabilis]